jgi:hypothetical protein
VIRARISLHRLFVVFFTVALGGALRAETPRGALTVTRDDGTRDCPDSTDLAARVEYITGRRLFDAGATTASDAWVQVAFVRELGGIRAVISAAGTRKGTRTLDDVGPGCASLADAVAVTVAILLDPAAPPTAASARQAEAVLPAPIPAPTTALRIDTPAVAVEPPVTVDEFPSYGIEASFGASIAVLEHATPLVEAGLRVRLIELFRLAVGGGFLFPDRVAYSTGTIDLTMTYGYVRGCTPLVQGKKTTLELCAEPMFNALRGSGNDYDNPDSRWVFWPSLAGVLQAYGTISQSTLWSLRALVLAPLIRQGFSVNSDGVPEQAFIVPPVGAMLELGVEVEL